MLTLIRAAFETDIKTLNLFASHKKRYIMVALICLAFETDIKTNSTSKAKMLHLSVLTSMSNSSM
jgi:hypothetical protein